MSLLIKALDKAQAEKAKAEGAKVKQEKSIQKKDKKAAKRNQKSKTKKIKTPKNKAITVDDVSGLSLSPPEESFISRQKEVAQTKKNLVEQKQRRAARALTIEPIDEVVKKQGSTPKPQPVKAAQVNKPITPPHTLVAPVDALPTPAAQAANVFTAKQPQETNTNGLLLLIAAISLIAIIAMGVYYYQFIDNTSEVVMPQQRQIAIKTTPTTLPVREEAPQVAESVIAEDQEQQGIDLNSVLQEAEPVIETNVFSQQRVDDVEPVIIEEKTANVERSLDRNEVLASANSEVVETDFVQTKKIVVSDSASIEITKNQKKPSVDPILMRAYAAYQVGDDAQARQSYKEVLRSDGLNVDAMLGLGAIAIRQGRVADANDWHNRVLQLEPRNEIATTALLYAQSQTNPQINNNESQIKSMLAKSPNDASLYAALGDVYVEQNQWSAAQQVYFEAYRLNSSADNAFNLAISLDQMGKPKLALPYYQLALEKAEQSQITEIDKTALQARILSIQ